MFTDMTTPPLDGPVVLRMMRLTNLNDVANDFDKRLIINLAQVGTAREAEGGELRTESMINGVVNAVETRVGDWWPVSREPRGR